MLKSSAMHTYLLKLLKFLSIAACICLVFTAPSYTLSDNDPLLEAISLFKSGKIDNAISKIEEMESLGFKEVNGSDIEKQGIAYFLKGHCYVKKGNNEKAAEYFGKASEMRDFVLKDYSVYSFARTLQKLNKKDTATEQYEKVILEYPESTLASQCIMFLAQKNAAEKNHKEAIDLFNLIINSPEDEEFIDEAKYRKGKSLEALGQFKEASETYFNLAFYHMKSEYRSLSLDKLKYLQKRKGIPYPQATADEFFERAMSFYNKGDYSSASYQFTRFLNTYSGWELRSKARLRLGISEYRRKRYYNANYHLKKIIKANGLGADEAQFYLSFVYGKWGYLNSAINSLRKVIWNYPKSKFADDASFYIGYYYDINNHKPSALAAFNDFIDKYPESSWAVNGLWRAGQNYYNQKKYDQAQKIFKKASENYPNDQLTAHCVFWEGMSAIKQNKQSEAKEAFLNVTKNYDHSFHSYQARLKLLELGINEKDIQYGNIENIKKADETDPLEMADIDIEENPSLKESIKNHMEKYKYLLEIGFHDHALREANYIKAKYPEEEKNIGSMLYYMAMQNKGDFRSPIGYAESKYLDFLRDGEISKFDYSMWKLAYPKGFWGYVLSYSAKYNLDPYLVLAVIREESRFNPKTVSWARAHGLMQIIPSTGRGIARLIGLRPYYLYKLFDPETNIKMGCYYLSGLMKQFNGNPYLALAGYNGGPKRVVTWVGKWKRNNGQDLDIDEFVESIPFNETRRYVKKVMKSYNEYRRIYETSDNQALPNFQG